MSQIILNSYWGIPTSIVRNERVFSSGKSEEISQLFAQK